VNGIPATSSRDQSPSNNMARHRTLRRAMPSASAKMPRRMYTLRVMTTGSSQRQNAPIPLMSAPGGLARRLWSDASANHMSVSLLCEHSPPNIMARHGTLRRAMPSASAKMPRTCFSVSVRDASCHSARRALPPTVGGGGARAAAAAACARVVLTFAGGVSPEPGMPTEGAAPTEAVPVTPRRRLAIDAKPFSTYRRHLALSATASFCVSNAVDVASFTSLPLRGRYR